MTFQETGITGGDTSWFILKVSGFAEIGMFALWRSQPSLFIPLEPKVSDTHVYVPYTRAFLEALQESGGPGTTLAWGALLTPTGAPRS